MNKVINLKNENRAVDTWKAYEEGLRYQASLKLDETIKKSVAFYEGDQWAPPTERTKNLPRSVHNFVRMIVNNKECTMNNKVCKIVYEADEDGVDTETFTKFADYQSKEMRLEDLDQKAVHSGVLKGTYIYHVYWDAQARGKKGKTIGAMRCEILDPRNVVFCNPKETDEQKQKYIIVATREEVDAVRESLPKGVDKEQIVADDFNGQDKTDQDGTELCTVLTKYFRVDGEVWCEKSTQNVIIRKAFRLRPDYEKARKDLYGSLEMDEANAQSPDDVGSGENTENAVFSSYVPTLYPIAVGQYIPREDSIYGISEAQGIIDNQKIINLLYSMRTYQEVNEGMSKWIVKDGALRNQTITNEAGQIITDYSKAQGINIHRVGGGQISNASSQFLDNFIGYTRTVTGSTEVMNGEAISANMSGAAIAQLQAQANQPIEANRRVFWRVKEKLGRILEQFFRMYYYEDTAFTYKDVNENGETQYSQMHFAAKNYENAEFTVVAKATAGTTSSPAGDIAVLNELLANKIITPKQWVESYPDDALSNKAHIVEIIKQAEEGEVMQLQQRVAQLEQQCTVLAEQNAAAQKALNAVQKTNNENRDLRKDVALLYNKCVEMGDANQDLARADNEHHSDALMFAQQLAKLQQQYNIQEDED